MLSFGRRKIFVLEILWKKEHLLLRRKYFIFHITFKKQVTKSFIGLSVIFGRPFTSNREKGQFNTRQIHDLSLMLTLCSLQDMSLC